MAHLFDVSEVVSRLLLDLREGHGRPAPGLRRWQALHRKRNQPPLDGGSSESGCEVSKIVYRRGLLEVRRVIEMSCVAFEVWIAGKMMADADTFGECMWYVRSLQGVAW